MGRADGLDGGGHEVVRGDGEDPRGHLDGHGRRGRSALGEGREEGGDGGGVRVAAGGEIAGGAVEAQDRDAEVLEHVAVEGLGGELGARLRGFVEAAARIRAAASECAAHRALRRGVAREKGCLDCAVEDRAWRRNLGENRTI